MWNEDRQTIKAGRSSAVAWESFERGHRSDAFATHPPSQALAAHSFPVLAAAVEFAILAIVIFETGAVYHLTVFQYVPAPWFYAGTAAALAAVYVVQCALGRDHSIKRQLDGREQLRSAFLRWNSAYSLWVLGLFIFQMTETYSRGAILAQYVAGLGTALIVRFILTRVVGRGLRSGLIAGRKTLVVGEPVLARDFARQVRDAGRGATIVNVVTVTADDFEDDEASKRLQERIETIARDAAVDDVAFALSWSNTKTIRRCIEMMSAIPATVHLAPDPHLFWVRYPVLERVGGHYTLRLARAPLTVKDRILKRSFDFAVASLMLAAAAPVLAAIAIAIKLDTPGPVLFRQRRNGFNQKEFRIFKFRTMTTLDDGAVVRQATKDDMRITRVGRLLRRTNLDELPQLLNVILGHMSLVGPRPHALAHNCQYEEKIRLYARRHNVKPGITGWAQVNGYRGETSALDKMLKRVEHDFYYIDHWSLLLDIRILLTTVLSPTSYRNAY
ncbi:MAG: undecaprenyl-phosphate glucose phosphotransferase [Xanthobacteraceae bacterium]|uniref:undecaprenyl-phosphate glucose phosphotransferase n=1 Tax=Pseudolabrys sp. TaxID=1960880 RepID=UPI003D121979